MKRTLREAATYVYETVESLGFDATRSSRLARMKRVFKKKGFIKETDPEFGLACEALRDIAILEFSFDQLVPVLSPEVLQSKVALIVKDGIFPQDSPRTPGRDTQTELYVAAVCQAAGLSPVFAEPDVVVSTASGRYGLAVKRVKNMKQLEKRFRDAASQIQRSGMIGFIVLDLMLAFNPDNERLETIWPDGAFSQVYGGGIDAFIRVTFDKFKVWQEGRTIRGVIIHDHLVRKCDPVNWELASTTKFVSLDHHNQARYRAGDRFWKTYCQGIPNPAPH